jgi:hypothetical protein
MTQNERLMEWLEINGGVEPLTAWSQLGIYRLAARVADLRKMGYNIASSKISVYNQWGEKATVAYYTLEKNNAQSIS